MGNNMDAQTILSDAKILAEYFNDVSSASANRVSIKAGVEIDAEFFKKYVAGGNQLTNDELRDNLEDAFKDNPFIRIQFSSANLLGLTTKFTREGSPASGFSVGGFADGLSRFLVKRTKQELSQAFFEGFKSEVKKDAYLSHFCPATKQHLLDIDQDVYLFKDYLEGLRESFIMDMTALPGNTEDFLRDDTLCPDCSQNANGKVMIDFLHLAQQLVNGEPPVDMISYLARPNSAIQTADIIKEPALYDMAGAFRFIYLVSESLRNPDSKNTIMPWFTGGELRKMFQDKKLFRIYLGLLWQQADEVSFVGPDSTQSTSMRNILKKAADSGDLFENWRRSLESLGEVTHALQLSILANASSPTSVSDDFFRYSETLTKLMQTVNETGRVLFNRPQGQNLIPQDYIFFMRQCNSLYFNVRQRNYTGAISNVIFCLNKIGGDKKEIATMLKYANFVASIAEANSPEEVENAIELFALPPGSSRMKKQPGRFTIALNAYTGLSGGNEYLDGSNVPKNFGAITAPVGISFSWGLGYKKKQDDGDLKQINLGSIGFFLPLLDVGAVTTFRFKDSTSQNLPELTWGNILAPGFYLVYDFPNKWPLAFGLGGQIGPGLRKVVVNGGDEIDKSGIRFGAFLTVDIPFTFFHLGKGN